MGWKLQTAEGEKMAEREKRKRRPQNDRNMKVEDVVIGRRASERSVSSGLVKKKGRKTREKAVIWHATPGPHRTVYDRCRS